MISAERLRQLLQKVQDATQQRDRALEKLDEMTTGSASSDAAERAADYVTESFQPQLTSVAEQAAIMAAQVQAAGRGAETSHKKVAAMDARLAQVRSALEVVQAVVKQRQSVTKISAAISNQDFEVAADYIVQYDSVKRLLSGFPADRIVNRGARDDASDDGASSDHSSAGQTSSLSFGDESNPHLAPDETIESGRGQLKAAILSELDAACRAKLEPSVIRFATMLARIGYSDEGCAKFTDFIVGTIKSDLKHFVTEALGDVSSGKTTHLVACVGVLDRIAAAMEKHKPFMDATFPKHSSDLVLALHSEATLHGVDVLKDFLSTRRGIVNRSSKKGVAKETERDLSKVDPRSLDQTLEDIAHLLTCCHQYLQYVATCVTGNLDASNKLLVKQMEARVHDSPLLREVGNLMNIYVPVQSDYLRAAFKLIVSQCEEAIVKHLQPLRSALEQNSSSQGTFTEALMGAVWGGAPSPTHTAAAAVNTVPMDYAIGSKRLSMLLNELEVTLVDDFFHLLLIAVRRAAGTRDVTIASATVNSVTTVLAELLLPELQARLSTADRDDKAASVAAMVEKRLRALWLRAAHYAVEYTSKLAIDFEHAAAANFAGTDLFRLAEQKHDFVTTANAMRAATDALAESVGHSMSVPFLRTAVPLLDTTSFVLKSEAAYVNAGLSDTWVSSSKPYLAAELEHLGGSFPDTLRDAVVVHIAASIAEAVENSITKKPYDPFGALQLDRDLRELRNFIGHLSDAPIREQFARVQAIAAALVADSVEDAVAESKGRLDEATVKNIFKLKLDN
jgi:hypothetical protein